MMDHSQCRVVMAPQWEEHTCPPCVHGLERGGTFALTGRPDVDAKQREMKLRAIESLTCADHGRAERPV